jgi:hypothetical protein
MYPLEHFISYPLSSAAQSGTEKAAGEKWKAEPA